MPTSIVETSSLLQNHYQGAISKHLDGFRNTWLNSPTFIESRTELPHIQKLSLCSACLTFVFVAVQSRATNTRVHDNSHDSLYKLCTSSFLNRVIAYQNLHFLSR
jgi:hypothetical protein